MRRCAFLMLIAIAGCGSAEPEDKYASTIKFKDSPAWEADSPTSVKDLAFTDAAGQPVDLKPYLGQKNIVLVMTRGYSHEGPYGGAICLYCATQTSRLITNYEKFRERNAEVLVVFPIASSADAKQLSDFSDTARRRMNKPVESVPFPVWLDQDLRAVEQLGIRADLSKPSTYILDKQGKVRFAYVGQSLSDRPSVKAVIDKLDEINRAP